MAAKILNIFSDFYAGEILSFLELHFVDTIPPMFFMMSLNRFTAIIFPLKYKTIWTFPVTFCTVILSVLLSVIPYILKTIVAFARKKTPYTCDTEISLYCSLYAIDDGELMFDLYDLIYVGRFIFNMIVCGVCVLLLFGASLRFLLTAKTTTANLIDAEKRLFFITIFELVLAIAYVFIVFSDVWQTRLGDIIIYMKNIVFFIYHFGSIAVFLILSRATRNAYFEFYFLDRIYNGTVKRYILKRSLNGRRQITRVSVFSKHANF